MYRFCVVLLVLCLTGCSVGLDNGLARTPPMGWMSWAMFYCKVDCAHEPLSCISEKLYMDQADRLVQDGYLAAGYNRVNVDDCWPNKKRDANGRLVANETRFPSGIRALANYMHSRGLKLGIYGDIGTLTCGGYPGTLDHIKTDADTFAEWGVDMLKLDGCNIAKADMPEEYHDMTVALNSTGRPMVYSCSWPAYLDHSKPMPYSAIAASCNLWRNYNDINASWKSIAGIIDYYDHHQDAMAPVHGPGQWNDPDMLVIGQTSVTVDQARAQMAIWSIWSAPLLMSNDLRYIAPPYKKILLNRKVIAVDQDTLGIMGKLVVNTTNVGVYTKRMTPTRGSEYSYAVVFFNRNTTMKANVTTELGKIGLSNVAGYFVEDLFTNHQHGLMKPAQVFSAIINPTGVVMIKATIADH